MLSASICPLPSLVFTNVKNHVLKKKKKKKQDSIYLKVYSGFHNALVNNGGAV